MPRAAGTMFALQLVCILKPEDSTCSTFVPDLDPGVLGHLAQAHTARVVLLVECHSVDGFLRLAYRPGSVQLFCDGVWPLSAGLGSDDG